MRRLLALLLLPLQLFAQESPQRKKIETGATYDKAIGEFIKTHPEAVNDSKGTDRYLFVKKRSFLRSLNEHIEGVTVKYLPEEAQPDTIAKYIHKKAKITILDLQMMVFRDVNCMIWVLPMEASFNPKKKQLEEANYTNKLCQYIFDYTQERDKYYYYKEASCRDME